jgi:hypothetical protein
MSDVSRPRITALNKITAVINFQTQADKRAV